jgi:hypothetical protein
MIPSATPPMTAGTKYGATRVIDATQDRLG